MKSDFSFFRGFPFIIKGSKNVLYKQRTLKSYDG